MSDALWERLRHDSPVTRRCAYFDSAAASAPPQPVVEVVQRYLQRTCLEGPYDPAFRRETYADIERIRALAAGFIGAHPGEVAFTKNATEAIGLVAQGLAWQPGDEVIVPDTEILSNLVPWLRLAQTRGLRVVSVLADEQGLLQPEAVVAACTPRTRLISFSSLVNSTGAVQPVQALCQLARQRDVLTLVNAAQTLGLAPVDVTTWDCDFLAACGRKGLRATEGSGLLYVKAAHIAPMEPCLVGWWNSTLDAATGVVTLPDTARRFEAGCPNVPAILGLGAALDYARQIGVGAIERRVRELTAHALHRLSALPGFQLYGPADPRQRLAILPFNLQGHDPHALVDRLARDAQVVIEAGHFMAHAVMRRFGIQAMARLSLHAFNDHAELDRCADTLARLCQATPPAPPARTTP